MNIVFGTKKLGLSPVKAPSEKYPDMAVVTVEGAKEAKKSRRILFNTKASELLNLESGSVQEIVFGFVEGVETPQILAMNVASIEGGVEEMVVYKTSKNKVSFSDSSEKAKSITSSHMCGEIFNFLSIEDTSNAEFKLTAFDNDEIEAFSFEAIVESPEDLTADLDNENVLSEAALDEPVIESNIGEMTVPELQDSVQEEIVRAEEANPVIEDKPQLAVEQSGIPQRQTVSEEWM